MSNSLKLEFQMRLPFNILNDGNRMRIQLKEIAIGTSQFDV